MLILFYVLFTFPSSSYSFLPYIKHPASISTEGSPKLIFEGFDKNLQSNLLVLPLPLHFTLWHAQGPLRMGMRIFVAATG